MQQPKPLRKKTRFTNRTPPPHISPDIDYETLRAQQDPAVLASYDPDISLDLGQWSRVRDATTEMHARIVLLYTRFDDPSDLGIYTATGFLLGPDTMVTAGHVLLGSNANETVTSIRIFIKHASSSLTTANERYWSAAYYDSGYTLDYDPDKDWAFFTLTTNVGAECGWFGFGQLPSSGDKSVSISGYPLGDGYRYYQYMDTGEVMWANGTYRMKHDYEPANGHSGSPLYDSDGIVWGIHTNKAGYTAASGVRFFPYLFNELAEHIDAGKARYGYTS